MPYSVVSAHDFYAASPEAEVAAPAGYVAEAVPVAAATAPLPEMQTSTQAGVVLYHCMQLYSILYNIISTLM